MRETEPNERVVEPLRPSVARPPRKYVGRARTGFVLIVIVVVTVFGPYLPLIAQTERFLADVRVALLYHAVPTHPRIAVIEIAEETLAALQRRSPVDRSFLSRLLRTLDKAEVRAIGVDILIDQPTQERDDQELKETLAQMSVPTVFAWAGAANESGMIRPWQAAYLEKFFIGIDNPWVGLGGVSLLADPDGTIRRYMIAKGDEETPPSMVLALSRSTIADRSGHATFPLAFYGLQGAERSPFNTLRADQSDPSPGPLWDFQKRALAGRVVLVGVDLPDTDRHRTPFAVDPLRGGTSTAGLLIHAHALAQLLDGREQRIPRLSVVVTIAVIVCATGAVLGFARLGLRFRAGLAVAALTTLWSAVFVVYGGLWPSLGPGEHGPLLPIASPTLGFIAAMAVGAGHARRKFRRERNFVRGVLMSYVAPPVVKRLLADPGMLRLGGESRELSIIFTDIAGFTTLSETIEPALLVDTLNEYLDGMTRIVHTHGGTLDKIVGDGIDAFWGAPLDDADHARHAVQCALEMMDFTTDFAARKSAEGIPIGQTRIGVHAGRATVGNFGGTIRLEYTAHGDVINTASRLEGANKYLGTQMLVSEAVIERSSPDSFHPVGDLILKGKEEAVTVYTPAGEGAPPITDYMSAYHLLSIDAREAEAAFNDLHQQFPNDGLVAFHLARIRGGEAGTLIILESK